MTTMLDPFGHGLSEVNFDCMDLYDNDNFGPIILQMRDGRWQMLRPPSNGSSLEPPLSTYANYVMCRRPQDIRDVRLMIMFRVAVIQNAPLIYIRPQ